MEKEELREKLEKAVAGIPVTDGLQNACIKALEKPEMFTGIEHLQRYLRAMARKDVVRPIQVDMSLTPVEELEISIQEGFDGKDAVEQYLAERHTDDRGRMTESGELFDRYLDGMTTRQIAAEMTFAVTKTEIVCGVPRPVERRRKINYQNVHKRLNFLKKDFRQWLIDSEYDVNSLPCSFGVNESGGKGFGETPVPEPTSEIAIRRSKTDPDRFRLATTRALADQYSRGAGVAFSYLEPGPELVPAAYNPPAPTEHERQRYSAAMQKCNGAVYSALYAEKTKVPAMCLTSWSSETQVPHTVSQSLCRMLDNRYPAKRSQLRHKAILVRNECSVPNTAYNATQAWYTALERLEHTA